MTLIISCILPLGKLSTCARWTRDFVTNHPEYKHDSVVSDSIAYDLLHRMTEISHGNVHEPSLIFDQHNMAADIMDFAGPKADDFFKTDEFVKTCSNLSAWNFAPELPHINGFDTNNNAPR